MKTMELFSFLDHHHKQLPIKSLTNKESISFEEVLDEQHEFSDDVMMSEHTNKKMGSFLDVFFNKASQENYPIAFENNGENTNENQSEDASLNIEAPLLLIEMNDYLEDGSIVHNDIIQFMQDIQQIIHQAIQGEETLSKKDAGHLLKMLEQWSSLQKQVGEEPLQKMMSVTLSNEEKQVFEQLLARFQKRNYFSGKGIYQHQANITKTDMVKWLQNTLQQFVEPEQSTNELTEKSHLDTTMLQQPKETLGINENEMVQQSKIQSLDNQIHQTNRLVPTTKIEQYIMHLQQVGKVEQISHELKSQFTMLVKESSFLQSNMDQLQLSITLNPTHLGNMNIRFMQVDGEMMVHMLVTSQSAKELLESNIHQLKSVFSPHQIVIEKDEQQWDDEYFTDEDSLGEEANEEHLQDRDHEDHEQSSQEEATEMDFETLFQILREEGNI